MDNDFSTLQEHWESHKNQNDLAAPSIKEIQQRIKHKEKENFSFYYGTLVILSTTLVGIILFFIYIAPIRENVSKIGWYLMILGLLLRIIIEVASITKAKKMNRIDNTLDSLKNAVSFHQFRKTIHNVVSPSILVMYTIGFFLMVPELSKYIAFWYLFLICASYFVAGIILFILIRKGVKKEMKKVEEIVTLQKEVTEH